MSFSQGEPETEFGFEPTSCYRFTYRCEAADATSSRSFRDLSQARSNRSTDDCCCRYRGGSPLNAQKNETRRSFAGIRCCHDIGYNNTCEEIADTSTDLFPGKHTDSAPREEGGGNDVVTELRLIKNSARITFSFPFRRSVIAKIALLFIHHVKCVII